MRKRLRKKRARKWLAERGVIVHGRKATFDDFNRAWLNAHCEEFSEITLSSDPLLAAIRGQSSARRSGHRTPWPAPPPSGESEVAGDGE